MLAAKHDLPQVAVVEYDGSVVVNRSAWARRMNVESESEMAEMEQRNFLTSQGRWVDCQGGSRSCGLSRGQSNQDGQCIDEYAVNGIRENVLNK